MLQVLSHSHADCIFLSAGTIAGMDSMDEHRAAVGERITYLREAAGLTQPQLATLAGISQPSLWAIEKGQTKEVTVRTLLAICTALETTLDYVWSGGADDEEAAIQEAELLAVFRQLQEPGRMAVLQSARAVREATGGGLRVIQSDRPKFDHPPDPFASPIRSTTRKARKA